MAGNLAGITGLSGLSVGGAEADPKISTSAQSAGRGLIWHSYRTYAVPALTLTANGSTTTDAVFPGVAANDAVFAHATSSMSSGAVLAHAFASAANTVTLVYSNASTAALSIVAQTIGVVAQRYAIS